MKTIVSSHMNRFQISPFPGSMNMHKFIVDQVTGKFGSVIGEFWFKFIEYVLKASIFHTADLLIDSFLVTACKWASYLALYFWAKHEFEKAMYYVWPALEPIPGKGIQHKDWQFITANTLAPVLTMAAFSLGHALATALASIKL
jgi:hypothetical protein